MRRFAVLAPIALLLAVLVARRRRRSATPPLAPRPGAPALPAGPRFLSVPWTLVAAPEDRPELTVRFERRAQLALDRVDAQETPSQVFVTVLACWRATGGGGGSPSSPTPEEATVQLAAPLGARELVHAPTDPLRANEPPL
jgi:hypothetical protein